MKSIARLGGGEQDIMAEDRSPLEVGQEAE